jgi:Amt family ammonium transporter
VIWGLDLLEYLRIDDPIGAVPVHMFAGMAGTMSLGLFAAAKYGLPTSTGVDTTTTVNGLFYGGGGHLLWTQTYGTFSVMLCTFVVAIGLMYLVKLTGTLRISEAGERAGLDIHEHGASAYPEFVVNRGLSGIAGLQGSVATAAAPAFASTSVPQPTPATVSD